MKIRFHCPSGHSLSVSDSLVGKRVRCAHCKQIARVPSVSTKEATDDNQATAADKRKPRPPKNLPKPMPESARKRPEPPPVASPATQEHPLRTLPSRLMSTLKAKLKSRRNKQPEPSSDEKSKRSRWSDTTPELPPQEPLKVAQENSDKPKSPDSRPHEPTSRRSARKSRRDRKRARGEGETAAAMSEPNDAHSAEPAEEKKRRPVRGPTLMPPDVCRPDQGHIATVKWLALALGLIVLFSTGPIFVRMHWNLQAAPGWARIVVLMAVLQAVYVAWMVGSPDWASVWVVMLVFAVVASIYGTATAMVLATPLEKPMPLGLEEVRHTATAWCVAVLSAMSLATYLCGRTAAKWRRMFELETAGRRKPTR